MELNNYEVFDGKRFKDLCSDIYKNQKNRQNQIDTLVSDIRSLVKTPNDAILMIPLIKGYLDVATQNDGQLVKLASIIQKLISTQTLGSDDYNLSGLSEEEKKQIQKDIEEQQKKLLLDLQDINKEDRIVKEKITDLNEITLDDNIN